MKYKIISMDFDGTLLTSDKKVSEKTKDLLKELKKNNYIIVGITARNLRSAKSVVDFNMFNYIILNNGAFIYNVDTNKITSFGVLTSNDLERIENIFKEINPKYEYVSLNSYFTYDKTDPKDVRVHINSKEEISEDIVRMNVYLKNEEQINYYKNEVLNNIDTVNVVSMKDTDVANTRLWLTINEKNTSKLSTLTKLAKDHNISLDEIIFFGDGENDLSLLENVGNGVAMGNAIDIVKERSKDITLSNNEDGIYNYLTKKITFERK